MSIIKLNVSNFRSFKNLKIDDLRNLTILVGANASGKSNFVEIFRFLRDISNHGLRNAISMQGGIEYLGNVSIGYSKPLTIKVVCEVDESFATDHEDKIIGVETTQLTYEFGLQFEEKESDFQIIKDILKREYKFVELHKDNEKFIEKKKIGSGQVSLFRKNDELDFNYKLPKNLLSMDIKKLVFFMPPEDKRNLPSKTLLLETPFFTILPFLYRTPFNDIPLYNFDPKLPRRSTPITGKRELEEDGSNLAIVLKNIIENEDKKRKFTNLVSDLLPFVEDIQVERFMDKSLFFVVQEEYNEKIYLPASLLSDGTIAVTSLITALYFEKKSISIFEEPIRNIYPALVPKMMDMMKEVSKEKQVIVTTHNPQVVKHAGLDNLLFIQRDKQGFSAVSRPVNSNEIKVFLKNEIGIDELFAKGLLGG